MDRRTNGQTDGRADGWMDGLIAHTAFSDTDRHFTATLLSTGLDCL